MIRDLAELARVTGGVLHGADAGFGTVTTDSRTLEPGTLFVALRGERFDGHDFVPQARDPRRGRRARERAWCRPRSPQVVVPDTLEALRRFAHAWRRDFAGTVVGDHRQQRQDHGQGDDRRDSRHVPARAWSTQGNLNNHIGVPLTLARLDAKHRYAVIEMGANHRGEIAHLASIAEPERRPGHQRRSRAPRGIRRHRGRGARQGRDVPGAGCRRHRGHQRRRPLRGVLARPRAGRRSRRDFRHARARRCQRATGLRTVGRRRFRDRVRPGDARSAAVASASRWRATTT